MRACQKIFIVALSTSCFFTVTRSFASIACNESTNTQHPSSAFDKMVTLRQQRLRVEAYIDLINRILSNQSKLHEADPRWLGPLRFFSKNPLTIDLQAKLSDAQYRAKILMDQETFLKNLPQYEQVISHLDPSSIGSRTSPALWLKSTMEARLGQIERLMMQPADFTKRLVIEFLHETRRRFEQDLQDIVANKDRPTEMDAVIIRIYGRYGLNTSTGTQRVRGRREPTRVQWPRIIN